MQRKNKIFYSIFLILFTAIFSLLHFNIDGWKPIQTYVTVYLSSSLIYLLLSLIIFKTGISKNFFLVSLVVSFIIRISFINTTPIGSDDIYRYIWDGKVQTYGINPYAFAPNDTELSNLHSQILPAKINFPNLKTIYFPLSEWFFFISYSLSGENVWGYKLFLFIGELITIFVLIKLLRKNKINERYVLFYALCPLPIIQFAIDSHLDGLGLTFLILSLLFFFDKRIIAASIFLGISLSIKPVGLLFIPVFFLFERKWQNRILITLSPLVIFSLQFLPYIFHSNPFESLFIFTKNWTFNGSIFHIVDYFVKNNQTSRTICGILLLTALIPIYLSQLEIKAKLFYSVLMLMLFSPVVHPWYIAWLVLLIPIYPALSGISYAVVSSLTSFTVLNYVLKSEWNEYWQVLLAEYLPVFVLAAFEFYSLYKKKKHFVKF